MNAFINILLLSVIAGLATGLGGIIAAIKTPGKKIFGLLMGFASGVMVTLSFIGLIGETIMHKGILIAVIGFTIGAVLMFLLDMILPHIHFAHKKEKGLINIGMYKIGLLIAIGIFIHNVPEGIAIGAGYLHLPQFGLMIAIAIGLHNIPEGIATVLPIFYSGITKKKAVKIAFLTGLAEPIGAVAAALFLARFTSLVPVALAMAGGVMVYITLDELIPCAYSHGDKHFASVGIIVGAVFMMLLSGLLGV